MKIMASRRHFIYQLGVVGVLASILTFAPSVQAAAVFVGQNGKIAYARTVNGSTSIWTINATEKQARQLVPGDAHDPVWSPGGQILAFVDNNQLYTVHADDSSRQLLTQARDYQRGYSMSSPVWLASGSRLAFSRTAQHNPQRSAVFAVDANGSHETNISGWSTGHGYRTPSWSPDGAKIVYEQFNDHASSLVIKNLTLGSVHTLTTLSDVTTSSNVSWSPNGKKILYNDSSSEIYTIWPDGSHRSVISDGESYSASWSPDGTKIAFLEGLRNDSVSIGQQNGDIQWIPIDIGTYHEIDAPSWSPDGKRLMVTMKGTTNGAQRSDLFMLDISHSNTTPILLAQGNLAEINWQVKPN